MISHYFHIQRVEKGDGWRFANFAHEEPVSAGEVTRAPKAMFHQRSRSLTRTGLWTTHTRGGPLFPVDCMVGACQNLHCGRKEDGLRGGRGIFDGASCIRGHGKGGYRLQCDSPAHPGDISHLSLGSLVEACVEASGQSGLEDGCMIPRFFSCRFLMHVTSRDPSTRKAMPFSFSSVSAQRMQTAQLAWVGYEALCVPNFRCIRWREGAGC